MSTVLPGNEGSVISYIIIEPCLETSSNFKRKLASNLLKDICNDRTLQKSKNIKKHLLDRKADVGQGAQKTRPSGKMYLSHSEHKVRTCTKCRAAMYAILCTDQVCKAPLSAASFAPAAPNVHMCKTDSLLDAPVKCPLHKPALWNRASKSQKRLRASQLTWNIPGQSLLLAPGWPQKNTYCNSEPRANLIKVKWTLSWSSGLEIVQVGFFKEDVIRYWILWEKLFLRWFQNIGHWTRDWPQ